MVIAPTVCMMGSATGRAAVAALWPPPHVVSSPVARLVTLGSACHIPTPAHTTSDPCRDDGSNGGERHTSNVATVSTGGFSFLQGGCSRIVTIFTCGEQLSSLIGRVRHSAHHIPTPARTASLVGTMEATAVSATTATRPHGEHRRVQLLADRL